METPVRHQCCDARSRSSTHGSGQMLQPWFPGPGGGNGCASVLSAMLATLIAMNFGFSVVISTAAVLYACAAVVFSRPLNAS